MKRRAGQWWPGGDGMPAEAIKERLARIEVLKGAGWKAAPFIPPKQRSRPMPGVKRMRFNTWLLSDPTGVWDHAYRLIHKSGRVLWVGEPYQLTATREMVE